MSNQKTSQRVGVVGLGLLGRGIVASLAASGQSVVAYTRSQATREAAADHLRTALAELVEHQRLTSAQSDAAGASVAMVDDLDQLAGCDIVIESIVEDMPAKINIYNQLEAMLREDSPIASNTSALPISLIQQGRRHSARFVGMHWGEPCHISRFLEVIRGDLTSDAAFDKIVALGFACDKEPSLVRKDVRGFITNRLMYAMLREAFHLLETGVGDVETIDRSFRNDIGFWSTIAGPFRWMDLTGVEAYLRVMEELYPKLANNTEPSPIIRDLVAMKNVGVATGSGFYSYPDGQAQQWMRTWTDFTWDIRALADRYVPAQPRRDA